MPHFCPVCRTAVSARHIWGTWYRLQCPQGHTVTMEVQD